MTEENSTLSYMTGLSFRKTKCLRLGLKESGEGFFRRSSIYNFKKLK